MKKETLISIVTPCFNSEKTIVKTLECMLNQTYKEFEYIIVDGGSRDNTLKIIEEYRSEFGNRIKVISEPDKGIYDAMNKGIKMATGKIIGIVNSDDFYECDALENIVKVYNGEQYAIFYGMLRTLSEGRESSIVMYNHEFLTNQMITHPSCFVTKKTYEDFGCYSLEYKSSADYEFMLRVFFNKKVSFIPVYKVLSNFDTGGTSNSLVGMEETAKLLYKYKIISSKKYYFKRIYIAALRIIHHS